MRSTPGIFRGLAQAEFSRYIGKTGVASSLQFDTHQPLYMVSMTMALESPATEAHSVIYRKGVVNIGSFAELKTAERWVGKTMFQPAQEP